MRVLVFPSSSSWQVRRQTTSERPDSEQRIAPESKTRRNASDAAGGKRKAAGTGARAVTAKPVWSVFGGTHPHSMRPSSSMRPSESGARRCAHLRSEERGCLREQRAGPRGL